MEGSPDAAPRMATAVGCLTQAALAAPAVAADAMPHDAAAAAAARWMLAASAADRLHAAPAISVSAAAATVACAPGIVRQQMMILKPKMM